MGAVLGALYAANYGKTDCIRQILAHFRASSLFGGRRRPDKGDGLHHRPGFFGSLARKAATWSVATAVSWRLGLRRRHPVNKAIDNLFGGGAGSDGMRFADLALPFGANAINLTRATVRDFTSGPLAPALKAGVAIGLVFAPFRLDGEQYADAAPLCPVPVRLCRKLGARVVLAVDIGAPLVRPQDALTGFDVVRRIMSMQSEELAAAEVAGADVTLRLDASDVFWGDFSRIDELVERGRAAAAGVLPALQRKLSGAT